MKPGERIVSAVTHRDFVLVFGDQGTVFKITHLEHTLDVRIEKILDLELS